MIYERGLNSGSRTKASENITNLSSFAAKNRKPKPAHQPTKPPGMALLSSEGNGVRRF